VQICKNIILKATSQMEHYVLHLVVYGTFSLDLI
jgi:hypothetical protein